MAITLSVEACATAPALRLRPWRLDDVDALVLAHRDPLLRLRLSTRIPDERSARRWIEKQDAGWAQGTRFGFAVERAAPDGGPGSAGASLSPAGTGRLEGPGGESHRPAGPYARGGPGDPADPERLDGLDGVLGHVVVRQGSGPSEGAAEVGYWTAAAARGRGIAPRALEAVSRWALGPQCPLSPPWLALLHAEENQASCRVAQKCGYTFRSELPPFPPEFPGTGHLHGRSA